MKNKKAFVRETKEGTLLNFRQKSADRVFQKVFKDNVSGRV